MRTNTDTTIHARTRISTHTHFHTHFHTHTHTHTHTHVAPPHPHTPHTCTHARQTEEPKAERLLEAEVTNTRSHRLGLDKVSQLFKDAHKERTEVIQQWEGTVQRLETEDAEIDAAATKFQALKAAAATARLAVAERQVFIDEQGDELLHVRTCA
jgi:hypothetical protein